MTQADSVVVVGVLFLGWFMIKGAYWIVMWIWWIGLDAMRKTRSMRRLLGESRTQKGGSNTMPVNPKPQAVRPTPPSSKLKHHENH